MTTHKPKKVKKYRGSKTHGCGSMKKRRGAGNRGGRGMAGSGKRADSKKPSIWAEKKYFGKFGFRPNSLKEKIKAVNVSYLEYKTAGNDIDLGSMGYNKLLGSGSISKKVNVKVKYASKRAIEKIKKAGGNVILQEKKVINEKKTDTPKEGSE